MDVGGWLRGLGLGQYEEKFRDNKIDADLLPRLTVDDLKDIGVSVVGDRRRLLDAIAVIAGAGPASPTKSAPSKGLQAPAERRPITVMFCDLVGSTSLAAKLDAEDWRNLVNAYLDEASAAVTGFGGHVLKRLGDGLMALFGYPHAQENDAERAVRAALAIQRALSDLNARNAANGAPELSGRIGIESGPVVVEASGEVFGDAPNVAARVQAAAEPGSVLITLNVQRQIAGLFVVEEQGARELRGVTEPVELFRIVRASGGGRRGGARTLTPFVGREEELGVLARRWERARAGEGQLVLIVGEPGLGKSRLIEEFHSQLTETPHTWSEWSASQLLQNTPLHPIAEWGRQRFGVDAPAEQRLADLENTLRLIGLDPAEHAPLLAPLVDIPLPPERVASFPPEELRRRQLAAMTAWILAAARTQAVALAFEDLHWADPTSLDLLRALADRGAQAPLLLLATTRPEFRPPWSLRSHHSLISLSPLDRAGVARMVGEISASHALPKEVIEGVSERTGGVPLFVEEVTRLLVERGERGGVQAIPLTLQQSLAARLDRLGPAREVAQIGAVLGRDFAYQLLRGVAELDESALQSSLERLAEADLVFVEGAPPEARYRFKHALIQDAAYDSLLKSRRQALHRRAAEALRDANAEPEAIAHHFTEAGLDDIAIEWWGKAGDQALRRSAFQEAIAHLGKAIELADRDGRAVARQPTVSAAVPNLTQLHAAQGVALFAARGGGALETTEAFARARESASRDEDAPERLAADYGLWVGSYVRGELPSMRAGVRAFLSDTEARPDSPEAGVAHRAAGLTCWFAGEYREARDHLERALGLFLPGRDDDLAFRFGLDPGVAAMVNLAAVSWSLGEVDNAISLIERMQTRLAGLTHVGMLAFGKMHSALFDLMRGDHARATPKTFELASLAREHELAMYDAFGAFLHGWTTTKSGTLAAGLENMRRGVAMLREQNILLFDGLLKIALAEAEAAAGDLDRALAALDEGLATAERMGFRAFEAELHRARGDILLQRDPANSAPAEGALLTAIAVAKQQSTRSFELRAAFALAKLYHATGRLAEAHAVLASALEGFSPTPEMPEIAEAQALLAALAETDEVKAEAPHRQRLTQLHVSYGNALIAARGYGAPETTEAFARARKSTAGDKDVPGRLSADYGLWVGSFTRGELPSMRAHSADFLNDVQARPDSPEAGVAHRVAGATCWFAGEYREAMDHLERALALFQPGRDDDMAFRFGQDLGVSAMAYLALVLWPLGEIERASPFISRMLARIASLTHGNTIALGHMFAAQFALMHGGPMRGKANSSELARIASAHDLAQFRAFGMFFDGWARVESDLLGGLNGMRHGVDSLRTQNILIFDGLVKIALAKTEAEAGDPGRAMAILDDALATADRTGHHSFEAELHRARGEILLKQNPANPAPAEEAFLTAIAVAKQQGTRSFELRAALALAKLYQAPGRPVDAHAVLAPALEGFAPTPEMPEIAEAQALLSALAKIERVREALEKRQTRAKIHLDYARAVQWAKGWGAEEARAAVERAHEFAAPTPGHPDYWSLAYGRFAVALLRGEFRAALEIAETYLRQAQVEGRPDHAVNARRLLGTVKLELGAFFESRQEFEKLLEDWDEDRDKDLRAVTGADVLCVGWAYIAQLMVILGEVDDAVRMSEGAIRRAESLGDFGSLAFALGLSLFVLATCGRNEATLLRAETFEAKASEKGARLWESIAREWASMARGLITGDAAGAATELRDIMAARRERQERQSAYMGHGVLARLQVKAGAIDAALGSIAEAFALAEQTGGHRADSFLHQVRGDVLAERDFAGAEAAYREALRIARSQGARTFELQAAHALAKLYRSTGRPADAHAILAPALEGFAPTPEMPEIAEAQALLAALAATDEVKAEAARQQRLTQLQVSYGNALIAARGIGAPETTEAFARAREGALGDKDAPERLAVHYGLWAGSSVRGDLPEMRAHAEAFLNDVEARPDSPEAGVAHRAAGLTCWFAGDYREARDQLERAFILFEPGRDDDLAFRFGLDPGVAAMGWLAIASWPLGNVDRAVSLIDRMQTRMANLTHVGTLANGRMYAALFELLRGNRARVAPNTLELVRLAQEYDLNLWRAFGVFLEGWGSAASGASGSGLEDMRRGVELLREQNVLWFDGLLKTVLAEAEAQGGDPGRAVAILDEALATCDRTGYRAFEAELHRARGEMLLKRDPANPTPGEEAFLAAIAVAKRQATRSFELRAALPLAKLYCATGRPAEAHAVLAPALDGFSPTPEMPEIAEAQALLAALAETEEVKTVEAQRQRRLHLQTQYGQAMMWAKGFAAEETRAAFSRATDLAANTGNFAARFAAGHGQWVTAVTLGEQRRARELASAFLKEAEDMGRAVEAGVARRGLAVACYLAGDFSEARTHCERALAACDPESEKETRERVTDDTGPVVMSVLAMTMWQLGEVERARELIDEVSQRARDLGHAPSMAHPLNWTSRLEILRGDAAAALSAAEELEALCREHGMPLWRVNAELKAGWARGRVHDAAAGAEDLRQALAAAADLGMMRDAWFYTALLAELEAQTLGADSALARIEEALVLAHQVDDRCDLPFPHLLRGELLLKRDPSLPRLAEEAFQTALAIAKEQGARSWGLRAALSLAKLYQSTGRLVDAQAVLAPALEGFAPTPEMPEIAEAQALLAAIEAGAHVRHE